MKPRAIRERIGLSRSEWARALNVNERTVARWEDEGADPGGLATEVMRGVSSALEEGCDPKQIGRLLSLGIASVLFYELRRQM